MRESFVFYRSFFEALVGMDKETQSDCLMAVADYALNGAEPTMTPAVRMFFTLVKPQLDANNQRFENGCKGGRPRKEENNQEKTKTKPKNNQTETNIEPNVNDNVNVNVLKKDNLKVIQKKQSFIKPSLEDVRGYCLERNNQVDPERWFDYYTSNGWKIGKNSMKDWRAAVRTWEKSSFASSGSKTQSDEEFYRKLEEL